MDEWKKFNKTLNLIAELYNTNSIFYSFPEYATEEDVAIIIRALQRQVPVKPIYRNPDDNGFGKIIPYEAKCSFCGHEFEFGTWNDEENHHCVCGQKMDWSEPRSISISIKEIKELKELLNNK